MHTADGSTGLVADRPRAVFLYYYTDSVAFPRLQSQSVEQTWPFVLAEMIRQELGAPVYPCFRGLGGATIDEIYRVFMRDSGYFCAQDAASRSIVIFNIGVVDAAPQPFTYRLRILAAIPRIGPRVWGWVQNLLAPHRSFLQGLHSYRKTSPARFARLFERMVRHVMRAGMFPVSIDTPLTPQAMEMRSPGLRDSIGLYNSLKHGAKALHVSTDWVDDSHLLADGHHFNAGGHREMAQQLLLALHPLLSVHKENPEVGKVVESKQ